MKNKRNSRIIVGLNLIFCLLLLPLGAFASSHITITQPNATAVASGKDGDPLYAIVGYRVYILDANENPIEYGCREDDSAARYNLKYLPK